MIGDLFKLEEVRSLRCHRSDWPRLTYDSETV